MVQVLLDVASGVALHLPLDLVAMSPHRVTATSSFWRAQSPADVEQDNADGIFPSRLARPLPVNTKIPLDNIAKSAAEHVSAWLRKHGKVGGTLCPLFQVQKRPPRQGRSDFDLKLQAIKPKLSAEQTKQTQKCFRWALCA